MRDFEGEEDKEKFYDVLVKISLSDPVKIGTGKISKISKKERNIIRESTRIYTKKFEIDGLSYSNVSVLPCNMKIDLKFERIKENDWYSAQHSLLEYFSGLTKRKMITGAAEYLAPYEFKSHSLKTKMGNPYVIKEK